MRILVFSIGIFFFVGSASFGQTAAEMKAGGEAERTATAAYRAKDYPEFLRQMETANRNRPNHPRLIYNLGTAYALNGRVEDALASFERLTKMGLAYRFDKDEDLVSLNGNARFKEIVAASNRPSRIVR